MQHKIEVFVTDILSRYGQSMMGAMLAKELQLVLDGLARVVVRIPNTYKVLFERGFKKEFGDLDFKEIPSPSKWHSIGLNKLLKDNTLRLFFPVSLPVREDYFLNVGQKHNLIVLDYASNPLASYGTDLGEAQVIPSGFNKGSLGFLIDNSLAELHPVEIRGEKYKALERLTQGNAQLSKEYSELPWIFADKSDLKALDSGLLVRIKQGVQAGWLNKEMLILLFWGIEPKYFHNYLELVNGPAYRGTLECFSNHIVLGGIREMNGDSVPLYENSRPKWPGIKVLHVPWQPHKSYLKAMALSDIVFTNSCAVVSEAISLSKPFVLVPSGLKGEAFYNSFEHYSGMDMLTHPLDDAYCEWFTENYPEIHDRLNLARNLAELIEL